MDKADWIEWHVANAGMIKALIAGSLISVSCSVIGCFIVLRRMAFLADAVAHAMLAGVVASYLVLRAVFGFQANSIIILVGALFAGLLTVALIGFVTRVSRVKEDAAIGIMYTGIFALGGFFASIKTFSVYIDVDLVGFVAGSVVATSLADLWMLAIVCTIVFSVVILFYRQLLLTSESTLDEKTVLSPSYLTCADLDLENVSCVEDPTTHRTFNIHESPLNARAVKVQERLERFKHEFDKFMTKSLVSLGKFNQSFRLIKEQDVVLILDKKNSFYYKHL